LWLKTAVAVRVAALPQPLGEAQVADMAASVQAAIVDVLCAKSMRALAASGLKRLVVAGGVGANRRLRARLDEACRHVGARVHYPEPALCTDNGAMIALAAAMRLQRGLATLQDSGAFDVRPRWDLAQLQKAEDRGDESRSSSQAVS
jgi:N6-L-threonylcarbamoyladenine synthase